LPTYLASIEQRIILWQKAIKQMRSTVSYHATMDEVAFVRNEKKGKAKLFTSRLKRFFVFCKS
jgi:hypothetical protein